MSGNSFQRVLITPSSAGYSSLVKFLAEGFRRAEVVPLVGAGISCDEPSALPLAPHLVHPLLRALWRAALRPVQELRPRISDMVRARRFLGAARMERLLDALQQTHGRPAIEYLSVLNGYSWNHNHSALAGLAKAGMLPHCITLNFDLLIEQAIAAYQASCVTVCPLVGKTFRSGHGPECLELLKPHGSFVPEHVSHDPYVFLSATLSQIGNHPADSNVHAFRHILMGKTVMLVAGYSDDDWDIFPILERLGTALKQVIWVKHAKAAEIQTLQSSRWETVRPATPTDRVGAWLASGEVTATLAVGPVSQLLTDVLAALRIDALRPPARGGPSAIPDAVPFETTHGAASDQQLRTLLALAMLVQQTSRFSHVLLGWLARQSEVQTTPELAWRVEDMLGHTEHTWGRINRAIRHTRRVIRMKKALGTPGAVAQDLVWLGYEHFCLAKRPNPLNPGRIIMLPVHVLRGRQYLQRGIAETTKEDRDKVEVMASYYQIDLLHSWANILMLFGWRVVRRCSRVFGFIARRYERLAARSELMRDDYYWMRRLETELLSGSAVDPIETQRHLDRILRAQVLVQNNVQVGNAYAYSALLAFTIRNDYKVACDCLCKAEEAWERSGEGMSSGKRRVTLFRRFIGRIGFWTAVRIFLVGGTRYTAR